MALFDTITIAGGGKTYTFSGIEVNDETDLKVKKEGAASNLASPADYTISGSQVTFSSAFSVTNGDVYLIFRDTKDDAARNQFYPSGSVRAQDLNKNFEQSLMAAEDKIPLFGAVLPDDINMNNNTITNLGDANSDDDAVNRKQLGNLIAQDISDDTAQGLQINKSTGGSNSNDQATITIRDSSKSQKGSVTINEAHGIGVAYTNGNAVISADKSTASQQGVIQITPAADSQGNPIQFVRPADGELTLGIPDNTIDLSKLKNVDVVTSTEQNTSPDAALTDDDLVTGLAATTRFDTIVSTASQTRTDYPIGKTWLQNDANKSVSIWDGDSWVGVASGGLFTELTQVIYVDAVNGDDSLAGHRVSNPKKTIKAALSDIDTNADGAGTTIILAPGVYQEELPLTITKENVSIVGSALRSCFIQPKLTTQELANYNVDNPTPSEVKTMFLCDSGTLIANLTTIGLKASGNSNNTVTRNADGQIADSNDRSQSLDPDAANNAKHGLPRNQGWVAAFRTNANIKKSPYIQNCTNFSDSKFNNSVKYDVNNLPTTALGGDTNSACTGGGILCDGDTPHDNSPLRSFVVDSFTQINLDGPGILVTNNGYAQLVSFFGTFCHYHAKALNGGQINLSNCTTDFGRFGLIAEGKSATARITGAVNGGKAIGQSVITVDGLTSAADFATNQPGTTMVMEIGSNVYQVLNATQVSSNSCNVTIYRATTAAPSTNIGLKDAINNDDVVQFKLRSYISTGGHTFEYVGSGTDYSAHPDQGGIANDANQIVELGGTGTAADQVYNSGKVWFSATDENGQFTVGPNFTVDQRRNLVEISNLDVATNVVNDLTPQLGGDLDLNTNDITGTGNINISGNITANGGSLTNLNASNLTSGTVATARLGSGTADTTTFLRGDNSWQVVSTDLVGDTTPQLGGMLDVNGQSIGDGTLELLKFSETASAVNELTITNAATGNGPTLSATGTDANINLDLTAKGTGLVQVTEGGLAKVPIVTQHDIGTASNEIPLNQFLGTAAFQDSSNFSVGHLHVRNDTSTANTAFIKLENRSGGGAVSNAHIEFQIENSNANDPRATIGVTENSTDGYADIVFQTSPQSNSSTLEERMRIKASKHVLLGTDNTDSATNPGAVFFEGSCWMKATGTGDLNQMDFYRGSDGSMAQRGKIVTNSSGCSFTSVSDYRLKENIISVSDGITRVKQLQPRRFNFIETPGKTIDGFVAHEVQAVVPEAATGTKDEVDSDNKPVYQGVDAARLVPLLTAALQEAIAKIETLETKVAALEG